MRAIETTATVTADGALSAHIPTDVPAGEYHVVLVIEKQVSLPENHAVLNFPTWDFGPWPENLSLRREDMYDEWGR